VPIEADGSVNFRAPSGIALHFQLLDGEQRALQTMKSFTGVQPGEVRGCFGCHEMHMNSAQGPRIGTAMRRAPSPITPVPWNDITVGYVRYVQSGLDAYCADCHSKDGSAANKAFNSRLRPGFLGFKEPYMTLMGNPTWGSPYHHRKGTGAFGWADTILVESYSTVDPKAYVTYPPLKKLSYASRLVKRFAGEKVYPTDKHPKVEVDDETLLRVKLWVDAMGPYSGVEELRAKEDPVFQGSGWISQPPRIHSAPLVRRPGPFDVFHPELDPAYAPPSPASYNALPSGVTRPQQQTVAAGTGR
jgi:cytochrome c553